MPLAALMVMLEGTVLTARQDGETKAIALTTRFKTMNTHQSPPPAPSRLRRLLTAGLTFVTAASLSAQDPLP